MWGMGNCKLNRHTWFVVTISGFYKNKTLFVISFLLFALTLSIRSLAQDSLTNKKIDPFFIRLIERNTITKNTRKPQKCLLKKKKKQEKYECIVYTKNAAAIREKGIAVNSELPTFVTALATLSQIQEMALITDVTYIEASRTSKIRERKPD